MFFNCTAANSTGSALLANQGVQRHTLRGQGGCRGVFRKPNGKHYDNSHPTRQINVHITTHTRRVNNNNNNHRSVFHGDLRVTGNLINTLLCNFPPPVQERLHTIETCMCSIYSGACVDENNSPCVYVNEGTRSVLSLDTYI